ncbi:PHP domain-containing protein [Nannocystis pusilla]|uniref:DNA-directed DNA polymerase n=1 Tax=Nannocystis pusilla TaxID=889268 RepID=A0ABS7TVL7_9BACT|nr:PHP domain-containing protein [Nannocystis pusilla]MBZ5712289.1 PHP domain-containing protein [Nannocystis pusilla]
MLTLLHVKSEYSLGQGTATPSELVRRASDYGYSALALTDVETLAGQVEFHHAAGAAGIRAITGVELRDGFGPGELGGARGRLVLLARDLAGYASLCRIVTRRRAGAPRNNLDDCLAESPAGLFYLADDTSALSELQRAGVDAADLRRLRPPDDRSPVSTFRAVADFEVAMLDRHDRELQRLLVAIRQQRPLADIAPAGAGGRSMPDPRTLRASFADDPAALDESSHLAEACALDLTAVRAALPTWPGPHGESPEQHMHALARARLQAGRAAGRWRDAAYDARLAEELAVVGELGFFGYFAIVCEITDEARRRGIEVAARGSAASSLLAHVLGITPIDPLAHGLHFQRFLHAGRRELPDIDLDLPSNRRDALIEWVLARFGADRAARVSTMQRLARRSAARELARALGVPLGDDVDDDDRLPAALQSPAHRDLLARLIGKPHHLSVHPGGVVVAEPHLLAHAPLERVPSGMVVTQYDMRSLARLGLVKIDLLGNRALSALADARRFAGDDGLAPADDPRTLQLVRAVDTLGCFQIESPPVRATLSKLPIDGVDDVMAALAVVRPGPASGGARVTYIRRARGEEPALAQDPRLQSVLRASRGMMIYDEDVTASIAAMTGWSLEQADAARATLAAAEPAALAPLQRRFLAAAGPDALAVWDTAVRFAAYSFNKAHAAGYAHLAWQVAAMKAHHPAAFACGVLDHYGGHYPLRTIAADLSRHGVRLLAPTVAHANVHTTLAPEGVRVGLGHVKHLTRAAMQQIVHARPFSDLAALLRAVPLGARELRALVLCGACDDLAPLSADAYPIAHEELLARLERDRDPAALVDFVARAPAGPAADLYRRLVRVRNELTFLHMHLSDHPLRILRDEARRAGCITAREVPGRAGRQVRVAGLIAASRRHRDARGRTMQFVTLEDETGLVEAVVAADVYAALGDPIRNPGPVMLTGRAVVDRGHAHVDVSQVLPFHRRPRPFADLARR